jgi:hypothetical protein
MVASLRSNGGSMAKETVTNAPEAAAPEKAAAPAKAVPPGLDPNRESLKSRRGREGKVFSDGFKIPGMMAFSDLPGKVCVKCGFSALKFSKQCPKCGGELVPEE